LAVASCTNYVSSCYWISHVAHGPSADITDLKAAS